MDRRYVELSGRIASCERFCEFLDGGGKVLDRAGDALWRDVTADALTRERRKVRRLERLRRMLYPEIETQDLPYQPH